MPVFDLTRDTIERISFTIEQNHAKIASARAALKRGQDRIRVTEMRLSAFRLRQEAQQWADAAQENREIARSLDGRNADDLRALKLLIEQTMTYQNMGQVLLDRMRELEDQAQVRAAG